MNKLTIPVLLTVTIMIAGAFAFMPVQDASTVHTTLQETATHYVEVVATSTAANDDFLITCEAQNTVCRILEIYLDNDTNATVNGGPVTLIIDGEDPFETTNDSGGDITTENAGVLNGVANTALGSGDQMRIEIAGNTLGYSLRVLAEVEANQTITVVRVDN